MFRTNLTSYSSVEFNYLRSIIKLAIAYRNKKRLSRKKKNNYLVALIFGVIYIQHKQLWDKQSESWLPWKTCNNNISVFFWIHNSRDVFFLPMTIRTNAGSRAMFVSLERLLKMSFSVHAHTPMIIIDRPSSWNNNSNNYQRTTSIDE